MTKQAIPHADTVSLYFFFDVTIMSSTLAQIFGTVISQLALRLTPTDLIG